MSVETASYLGPAKVLEAGEQGDVRVAVRNDDVFWARVAMAIPYTPAPGDEVLVIRDAATNGYVIGVLQGLGTTTLRVPSDLRIEAPHGHVLITAGKAIQLRSEVAVDMRAPRATFRFARLNLVVTTLVQRLTNAFTWATGLVQFKSERLRWFAEEGWFVRAGRAHVRTSDNIHIAGKTIHLG